MIGGGVTAIVVFQGFAMTLLSGLQKTTIRTQTAHIQIASNTFWKRTAMQPKEGLLPNAKGIREKLRSIPNIQTVASRITFFGLLSKGEQSFSVRASTYDVQNEVPMQKAYKFMSGHGFKKPLSYQVTLGSGLASRLGVKVSDRVTLLTNTFDGVVNALDLEVIGIFRIGITELDDSTVIMPLKTAQKLLDTTGVEQFIIMLDKTENVDAVLPLVREGLPKNVIAKPWYQIAKLYQQVVLFNKVQNRLVELIILTLIILSILNTIGMSIFERTGEIGTLAALGETKTTLLTQFMLEGLLLGLLGALVGMVSALITVEIINSMHLPIMIPGSSAAFILKIAMFPKTYVNGFFLAIFAAVTAACIPAYRASNMNIAEALRRNI
jgi:putative ABC transport system permease protein